MATLASLSDGALVKFGSIYGDPIVWRVIGQDHYASGQTTLQTENIIKLACFDAIEASNSDSNRQSNGNNDYALSNMRQWLNSDAVSWYVAQHSADAPPSNANVWNNYNEYDAFPGFLNGFTTDEKNVIISTNITYGKASVDGGGTATLTDKVFLLSCTEVGLSGDHVCGTAFSIYPNDSARVAKPTADAVSNSEYTDSALKTSNGWYWWLRDAQTSSSYLARFVGTSGALDKSLAHSGVVGARPALNLSSSTRLSSTTDADGCYTLVLNEPPEAPESISVPDSARTDGGAVEVSWSAGTDPDGDELTYRLQRRANALAWETVYDGPALSYGDTGVPYGATTVAWRVCAIDPSGMTSSYVESGSATVVNAEYPMSTLNFAAWLLAADGDGGGY